VRTEITVTVNGTAHEVEVDTRLTLVAMLRDELGLTGTHVGCAAGSCGACTVLLEGETVKSCCILAADADGSEVSTIEGLAEDGALHPIQAAFVENHGLQCGFCTPGMIMSTVQLLGENADPSEEEIRRAIAGNLCRCTGYHQIVVAVREAARALRE
jgi:carbon-monoxide dehydrogenase small subunit